jgi:hypothetical protein
MKTGEWIRVDERLPDERIAVETKIDDGDGVRNVGKLKCQGHLWFFEDMSMYVYYRPTHWRYQE